MHLQENYPLKDLNSFHINAFARYFLNINSLENIRSFLQNDSLYPKRKLVLGGGSNVLFKDDFDGVVLKNNLKGIEVTQEDSESVYVKFGSGENWHDSVIHCLDHHWYGLENLSLIPGTVGAAPIQNIGAYGTELKVFFHGLTALNLATNEVLTFSNEDCYFGYRNSIFKTKLRDKLFICDITLKLSKSPNINISYRGIREYLDENGIRDITPKVVSDAVIAVRKSKLPDPELIGNGGSFFKNPIISSEQLNELQLLFPDIPYYRENDILVKIPAAYLIQECDWKGYRKNDAGVHVNQPLVLVNYGSATGEEIVNLSKEIQSSVYEKFQIKLEPEVNII